MKRELTIALPSTTFLPNMGGVEVALHNIAIRLKKMGYRPIIITSMKSFMKLKQRGLNFPYEVYPFPPQMLAFAMKNPRLGFWMMDRYFRVLNHRFKFDLWHCITSYPIGIFVIHYALPRKIPCLVGSQGRDIQKEKMVGYGLRLDNPCADGLVMEWLPQAEYLVAITESIAEEYRKLGITENKILRIPNGVDTKRFKIAVDRKRVKAFHNIPADTFMYLCVGRNHPKKGFIYLIDAVEQLVRKGQKHFRVVLVGRGLEELESRARMNNISDYFHFIRQIDDLNKKEEIFEFPSLQLIELYAAADAFVFPSLIESFGIVIVEAMAAGLPIITTDAPGCRDLVKHKVNGLLVPPADPSQLALAMQEFLEEHPQQLAQYASSSLTSVAQFDWSRVVDEYISVYKELISHSGKQLC